MNRRQLLLGAGLGAATALLGSDKHDRALAQATTQSSRGLPPLKITKVRPILTTPQGGGIRMVVVKVETSEPGLYGLGCATFNQRALAVKTAVEQFLDPFCRGRDADNIEDVWQTAYTSSYWRNGPVLNNALSGLDQALWDIKGKRAGMPVYQLLGGKCRFAVECYTHASGRNLQALESSVAASQARGFRHIRIQVGAYGSPQLSSNPDFKAEGFGRADDTFMDEGPYLRMVPKSFEYIREKFGDDVELLHDVHERIEPIHAIQLCKDVEKFKPFFIEDPLAPEANDYFRQMRGQTSVPIAMGELFNSPHEWTPLITERLINFIRCHISQVGGLTPARKIAILAEAFQVRTAWHGPADVSPIGHACNAHLDLVSHNFGIQESVSFNQATQDVFPGCPVMKKGFMHVNEGPGWGMDINEDLAKKFPLGSDPGVWLPVRRRDGTTIRP
ncbi:MAG TPA: enolase C-terminal domain-like protein [Humisphaera sp.]|jgi:mannonate dehydratase|nr:enolase C-terminal domain-like protein [Humisphaera sp.]